MSVQFPKKTLLAATLFALCAPAAIAGTAPNLPTNGEVITSTPGVNVIANTSTIVNNPAQVPGLNTTSAGLTVNISGTVGTGAAVVIGWNATSAGATLNPSAGQGGFDVGSQAVASFTNTAQISSAGGKAPVNVLNIDTTSNPSTIDGALDYNLNGGSLWIANANGIVVGSGATITAPNGLGLIATTDEGAISIPATTFTSGTVGLSFADSTTGSVTIDQNANLSGVGSYLLVAGNNVNVATTPGANASLYIDGGISANVSAGTGVMTPNDGVGGYTDAASTVIVNIGSTGNPYGNLTALVDGNLTNNGSLTVTQGQINWINGTFTNNGTLDVTPASGQSYGVLGFETFSTSQVAASGMTTNQQYINDGTSTGAPTGDFVNAGALNVTGVDGFGFFGAGFQNNYGATLNVAGSNVYIGTSNDGVTLAGSMSSLSGSLAVVALGNNSVINVQSPINASTSVLLAANTVNISSTIDPLSTFTFFGPESGPAQMNIAAGGSIDATNVYLGTQGSASSTNFVVNGTIDGATSVLFGSGTTPTLNVSGAGSITTPSLTFANLQGNVNNIISPVIAKNGFQINPVGYTGTTDVSVSADGTTEQGVNLKVNGNLTIDSGNTQAIDANGVAPANANSILYVQATGNVQVNAGSGANNYGPTTTPTGNLGLGGNGNFGTPGNPGLFQFPGLVYLQAGSGTTNSLTVGSSTAPVVIANAFSNAAQFGRAGVFLIAPTINYNYDPTTNTANTAAQVLYTNGNAGVVFAAPYTGLGFPNAIINGALSSTTNLMPQIDFLQSVTSTSTYPYGLELVPTDTFTNASGQLQQFQTFLNLY